MDDAAVLDAQVDQGRQEEPAVMPQAASDDDTWIGLGDVAAGIVKLLAEREHERG